VVLSDIHIQRDLGTARRIKVLKQVFLCKQHDRTLLSQAPREYGRHTISPHDAAHEAAVLLVMLLKLKLAVLFSLHRNKSPGTSSHMHAVLYCCFSRLQHRHHVGIPPSQASMRDLRQPIPRLCSSLS
jgi:hypothetical protein